MSNEDMIRILEKVELAARRGSAFHPPLETLSDELLRIIKDTRNEHRD